MRSECFLSHRRGLEWILTGIACALGERIQVYCESTSGLICFYFPSCTNMCEERYAVKNACSCTCFASAKNCVHTLCIHTLCAVVMIYTILNWIYTIYGLYNIPNFSIWGLIGIYLILYRNSTLKKEKRDVCMSEAGDCGRHMWCRRLQCVFVWIGFILSLEMYVQLYRPWRSIYSRISDFLSCYPFD